MSPSFRRVVETGYDRMAESYLATKNPQDPAAEFIKADMTTLAFGAGTFDAVVAFYSIIHVPRVEHAALLAKVYSWLKPGGFFLATLSIGAWEGEESDWEGWGSAMRWSHYDRETNVKMLNEAGFEIRSSEARTGRAPGGGDETWLWVLARKPRRQ